ncbi:protein PYRICULARIA ORYZAE RESISTANCE 21 isoform X2 [Fagus crenata]
MGEKKKTLMVLKADLQCCRCYKKVKKVLCKFPQIQDQVFKEKENLVLITVVCCCPEKLKQKIICKGGGTITCIEIKEPEKPKDEKPKDEKPKDEKPKDEKPKDEKPKDEKPKDEKPTDEKPKDEKPKPVPVTVPAYPISIPIPIGFGVCCEECYEGRGGGPCHYGHGRPLALPKVPVPIYPSGFGACCEECSEGRGGGPCHYGHGRPGPLPCYGTPVYDSYGGGYRSCYARQSEYYCEESSPGCTIM